MPTPTLPNSDIFADLVSPALVIDRAGVRRNIASMIAVARSAERLRPHVKTHKMPAMIRLLGEFGIKKHKCATIAEAEMVAAAGGGDVLIAYPAVGPNVARLVKLVEQFPETTIRAVVDNPDSATRLSEAMSGQKRPLSVLLDLDVGMGRTGIAPGDEALTLWKHTNKLPNLVMDGLHAYDGHVRDQNPSERALHAREGSDLAFRLRDRLAERGFTVNRIVLGGTPSFLAHAALTDPTVECSPGTCVFHDASYANSFPDLPFAPVAVLLSRVVSRPKPGRLCLDLGYKAVAADPVGARVQLVNVPGATLGGQSEEHLVVDTPAAGDFPPGTPVFAIPTHICPTCALHRKAYVYEDGAIVDEWDVTARDRILTI